MDKEHAELGASGAERWMQCPGSVALARGLPNVESVYAQEGTVAHALAEMALSHERAPSHWIGSVIDGVMVDADMAEAVDVFCCECLATKQREEDSLVWIEYKFSLNPLNPPAKMFGTADYIVYLPLARRLVVLDYKHGRGVVKEVKGNPQPPYYGLGALLEIEQKYPHLRGKVDEVECVIIQPRAPHLEGIVRREVITYADLLAFSTVLMEKARATLDPDAALVPGEWCRFCRAAGVCTALSDKAQAIAQTEWDVLPEHVPPDPRLLPVEVLAHVMDHADILEDWLKAVRGHATGMLERGEEVPGWKLVAKRAQRKWENEKLVRGFMRNNDVPRGEYMQEPKLLSVAQMEKMLKQRGKTLPEDLYEKKSSGHTIAPVDDKRDAITLAPEFPALPPGDSTT